ncbi:aminoglycoside adenylyltransferase domain-containing protein [Cytobacillus sp. FJAT-54145]|uniref:Aminoglycoside adenylyltransferase domain-containing protein n=1 Tax=Cytobacillus spartinae TaxID=3299023 RepID=A0ABW6K7C9_9BACI
MSYPEILRPLLLDYIDLIKDAFLEDVLGVYLYGSIALEGYEDGKSDIDFITVLKKEVDDQQFEKIKNIHSQLISKHERAYKMDGIYVGYKDLGKSNIELETYPFVNEGHVRRGHWDINHVTWWSLKNFAIPLTGIDPNILPFKPKWKDVEDTMQFNLDVYWRGRASRLDTLLEAEDVSDAVLTLCRIHYTLCDQLFIPKVEAGCRYLNDNPTSEWGPLIKEAVRLRTEDKRESLYVDSSTRAKKIVQFIEYMANLYGATNRL